VTTPQKTHTQKEEEEAPNLGKSNEMAHILREVKP
jgi:hypothetical protein